LAIDVHVVFRGLTRLVCGSFLICTTSAIGSWRRS